MEEEEAEVEQEQEAEQEEEEEEEEDEEFYFRSNTREALVNKRVRGRGREDKMKVRKDPRNPLTGVFATHSPMRPNLIALTRCKIMAITDHIIEIEAIDAIDGSPVIDIKCYIPGSPQESEVRVPEWVKVNREDTH